MRYWPLFIFLLLFTGCSLPKTHIGAPAVLDDTPASQLLNISFKRWSKPIFSGLLAIKRGDKTISYVLLDSSGLTLAQALVNHDGNYSELKAVPKITDSGLPSFLARALWRIYLLTPGRKPCSHSLLFKFCAEYDKVSGHKYVGMGPFTLFDIKYLKEKKDEAISTTVYSQPWFGIQITLKQLKLN